MWPGLLFQLLHSVTVARPSAGGVVVAEWGYRVAVWAVWDMLVS